MVKLGLDHFVYEFSFQFSEGFILLGAIQSVTSCEKFRIRKMNLLKISLKLWIVPQK